MHTNVQLKTRSHTCVHVFFLRRRIYIPLLSYETHVCISYFPITLTEKMFLHNFWHTRHRFWKIVCLDRRVCTQVLRLRTTDHEEDWQQRPRRNSDHHDWPRQSRKLTMKNDWPRRLTTIMTLHHFDLWGRVRVQLLTYVFMSGWKVSIVLLSANTIWVMFAVKKDVSVRIFWHTNPWLCAVWSIISHWFTQCDVSLQNCIHCETWRRASFH